MPYFEYVARDKAGKQIKGQFFATTKQHLITNLQRDGMLVTSVKEATSMAEGKNVRLHKKAKPGDIKLFAKEFAVLLENGIPIMDGLDVLIKQMTSTNLITATRAIRKDLENGSTLANAVGKNPQVFNNLWHYMIEAGETAGQLPFVFRQMVAYLESRELIRKKTVTAMMYPAVLLIVGLLALFFFTFNVVPIFKGIYKQFNALQKLPPITKLVIWSSETIASNYLFIIIGLVIIGIIFKQIISTKTGRRVYERTLLGLPVIGKLYLALLIERFASTLKVLLKSGITIIKAMEMAANTSQSKIFSEKLEETKIKVTGGLPFSEALQQTALFPPLVIQLVLIAEKTGNYAGMFEEITNYYHEVLDTAIDRFTALIEPVMLIVMALGIGTLIISMYIPIFGLANL
jgi:type IV pilus assembly protein PilC